MSATPITCPACGHVFELSDALTRDLREDLRKELSRDVVRRETELARRQQEAEVLREELTRKEASLEEAVRQRVTQATETLRVQANAAARAELGLQIQSLQQDADAARKRVREAEQRELELRKERQALTEKQESLELDLQRRLDEERNRIRREAETKALEAHRLKDLEKEKTIQDLKRALDDMQRKASQGSMETQGEVLELDFEARLRSVFPGDEIAPVPKGIRGADIMQTVRDGLGRDCGVLLWETKNTKGWSSQWIPKLKDDMIQVRAALAILVSVVLPEAVDRFGEVEGVWVSDPLSALPLAAALRHQLLALARERVASEGKNEKTEMVYRYLTGSEFRQKIEGIVEAFGSMQGQLLQERRAMEKHWKQREKQIERVVRNTVGLYGDMQGIIGAQAIPDIPALELGTGEPDPSDPDGDSTPDS